MKTITLKNFPEDLLSQLKQRAKNNNRSLNSEIIHILKEIYGGSQKRRYEIMEQAKKIRESISHHLTDDEINKAKREGRS